ncbi:hypothetical protein C7S14_6670 [Burkholderia cepacia]|nr:hypothetical protein C7S14_6670 [Burkholderia cepacia]
MIRRAAMSRPFFCVGERAGYAHGAFFMRRFLFRHPREGDPYSCMSTTRLRLVANRVGTTFPRDGGNALPR